MDSGGGGGKKFRSVGPDLRVELGWHSHTRHTYYSIFPVTLEKAWPVGGVSHPRTWTVRWKCLEEKELWIRVWKHGSLVHDNDFLLGSGVTPDSHFTSLGCSTLIFKMRGRLDDS